jgi:archaellum component FlaC
MKQSLHQQQIRFRSGQDVSADHHDLSEMLASDVQRLDDKFHSMATEFDVVKSVINQFKTELHLVRSDIQDLTKTVKLLAVVALITVIISNVPWERFV